MVRPLHNDGRDDEILVLTTEQQAFAFDLSHTIRVGIGRHESNDVLLELRNVSNYHAEILNEPDGLLLHDLGSTNGTFVNDQRITREPLRKGDRVRMGSYELVIDLRSRSAGWKAVVGSESGNSFGVGTSGRLIPLQAGSEEAKKTLTAPDPGDISLPDLLTLFSLRGLSAMLEIRSPSEVCRIYVQAGEILDAACGRVRREKAFYRPFLWQAASYEVKELPPTDAVPRSLGLPTNILIDEGMKEADGMMRLSHQMPSFEKPLRLNESCPLPLCALSAAEFEIFRDVLQHQTISGVLENAAVSDFRALRLIHSLVRKKVFEVEDQTGDNLRRTH